MKKRTGKRERATGNRGKIKQRTLLMFLAFLFFLVYPYNVFADKVCKQKTVLFVRFTDKMLNTTPTLKINFLKMIKQEVSALFPDLEVYETTIGDKDTSLNPLIDSHDIAIELDVQSFFFTRLYSWDVDSSTNTLYGLTKMIYNKLPALEGNFYKQRMQYSGRISGKLKNLKESNVSSIEIVAQVKVGPETVARGYTTLGKEQLNNISKFDVPDIVRENAVDFFLLKLYNTLSPVNALCMESTKGNATPMEIQRLRN